MEEEEEHIPSPLQEPEALTPFRLLLHRAISFLQREEEQWEQEMLRTAIENSLETFQESLFVPEPERKPVVLPTSVLEADRDEECHLCLENLKMGDQVATLPCRHCFHVACVEELIHHQHMLCPLCREPITTTENETSVRTVPEST